MTLVSLRRINLSRELSLYAVSFYDEDGDFIRGLCEKTYEINVTFW